MKKMKKQAAVMALLGEYQKAVIELQQVIDNIAPAALTHIVDKQTENLECISIQSILLHIVSSGYSYAVYIQNSRGIDSKRPEKKLRESAAAFKSDLDQMIAFTNDTFADITDAELESFTNEGKIKTAWGQVYDIEQLMEHAIVHVLRHRRQIEKYKEILGIQ